MNRVDGNWSAAGGRLSCLLRPTEPHRRYYFRRCVRRTRHPRRAALAGVAGIAEQVLITGGGSEEDPRELRRKWITIDMADRVVGAGCESGRTNEPMEPEETESATAGPPGTPCGPADGWIRCGVLGATRCVRAEGMTSDKDEALPGRSGTAAPAVVDWSRAWPRRSVTPQPAERRSHPGHLAKHPGLETGGIRRRGLRAEVEGRGDQDRRRSRPPPDWTDGCSASPPNRRAWATQRAMVAGGSSCSRKIAAAGGMAW